MVVDKHELLTIMMEEAAEVIVECSKMIRFNKPGIELEKELGDLLAIVQLANKAGIITQDRVDWQIPRKLRKLREFSDLNELIDEVLPPDEYY